MGKIRIQFRVSERGYQDLLYLSQRSNTSVPDILHEALSLYTALFKIYGEGKTAKVIITSGKRWLDQQTLGGVDIGEEFLPILGKYREIVRNLEKDVGDIDISDM